MLDTNIISEIARNPSGLAARRFMAQPTDELCTSIVVSAEVYFGFENGISNRLRELMITVLDNLQIVPLEPPVDQIYARLRLAMKRKGRAVSPNDMFIAAHALAIGATIVTDDRAFEYVPGLEIENWLQP